MSVQGENVSTTELEYIIAQVLHMNDVIVYGVSLPGLSPFHAPFLAASFIAFLLVQSNKASLCSGTPMIRQVT